MRKQLSLLMVGVLALLAAVSCASGGGGATGGARESAGASGSKGAGDLAGDIQVNIESGGAGEDLTPILMRVVEPPEPVKGSDGKFHLVYELKLTNVSPGMAKVKSVKTIDPSSGKVVGTLADAGVAARMTLLGDLSLEETTKIGAGQTTLVFLDATFEDPGDVPEAIEHRLKVSFKIPATFASNIFPTATTEIGARTEVSREKPVVLGPPLKGKNWVAFNGCCTVSSHRGAMIALDQRLLATERYAIDWIKADDQGRVTAGFPGDPKKLKSYPSYGKPVLSVADGEVVKVVDKYPDVTPSEPDLSLKLEALGGNYVIVDIGGGRYAFYAHLKPDSIKVEEGDRVTRGQELARLGNSGNTTAPHLHFHVMDAPVPLGADRNLPYVFDAFDYQGAVKEDATPDNITLDLLGTPEPRKDELPLANSSVTFAAP
jgi:murein DD-endopeptidase MepM/ murein hydrolase activator NlpD